MNQTTGDTYWVDLPLGVQTLNMSFQMEQTYCWRAVLV
jgi:hypothetical protein